MEMTPVSNPVPPAPLTTGPIGVAAARPAELLLDGLTRRLGANRWVVCWRDDARWIWRASTPSLRDVVLCQHAGRHASVAEHGALLLDVAALGDVGSRLATAGLSQVLVLHGPSGAVLYLEEPLPDAARRFVADPGVMLDVDLAAALASDQLAAELVALSRWLPTLEELRAKRITTEAAIGRLGELAGCELAVAGHELEAAVDARGHPPTRAWLRTASELLGLAITRSLAPGQSRRDSLLRERARIGSVIHEGITQVLTNVAIQLEVLDHVLDDPEEARTMIRACREALLEALDSLRSIIFDLTPRTEEWTDLVAGLQRFADDFTAQWGITVALDVEGEPREVDDEVTSLAFAFVQEGLTNARKHAGTDQVRVHVAFPPGRLALAIVDAGVGVDPEAREDLGLRQHQGLRLMESRVRLMDGIFELGPGGEGDGTRLRMEIPG